MIEVSLASILVIAGLLMTFFFYVAIVSYRLGKLENRVETNEKKHDEVKEIHASKSDFENLSNQIKELKSGMNRIFELFRDESEKRYEQALKK